MQLVKFAAKEGEYERDSASGSWSESNEAMQ